MSPYVYRGTLRDVKTAAAPTRTPSTPGPKPKPRVFDPAKCGTYKGYKQHQDGDTEKCQPCKDANAAYSRAYGARPPGPVHRGFRPDKCGTRAGYFRHLRHGVPVCGPCAAAHAGYMAAHRAKQKPAEPIVRAHHH
jgi:hypothetical protein